MLHCHISIYVALHIYICTTKTLNITHQTLFERSHAQHLYFLLSKEAPVATTEILLCKSCKLYTVELHYAIAEVLEDTANDTVLAAVNLDAYLALVGVTCILDSVCMHLAVLKLYAVSYLLQVVSCNVLVEIYMVDLLLEELRMCKLRSQVAIVGEQEHTGGVAVETSYRVDALGAYVLNQIHYGLALLGIVACCHAVLRLVEQHVHFLLKIYRLIVEFDFVGALYLCSEFGNYFSVYRHNACLDELVSLTARANTGVGKELVETYRLVGIYVLLLVLDTLLHAILSIGIIIGRTLTIAALLIAATLLITAALLVSALLIAATLLIAALTLIATLTRLIATLLVAALLLVVAFLIVIAWTIALLRTLLIAAGTLLIATLALLIATLTGLIATLTRLVSALLVVAFLIVVAWTISLLWSLLIATLALLVSTLTLLIAALTWLIAAVR